MNHQPIKLFLLWIGELFTATLVSIHLDFDMNDFRVWSLWALSITLGMLQLIDRKKGIKETIKKWYTEMIKDIKSFFGR